MTKQFYRTIEIFITINSLFNQKRMRYSDNPKKLVKHRLSEQVK